jgi:hypothetical protein
VLFEWIRARKKEQAQAETISLKAIAALAENLLFLKRLSPVISLRALGHEFTRFKKDSSMKRISGKQLDSCQSKSDP